MKKHVIVAISLILITLTLSGQRTKDVLYLKDGSIIFGKLVEIVEDHYKIQTSDGSVFIYQSSDVEKFTKESPRFDGRRSDGMGFALEAGLLAGAQNTEYSSPFSFNFLAGYIYNTKSIISIGSGVEFIGKTYTPFFLEYKHLINDRKTSPFVFIRGGALVKIGDDDPTYSNPYYEYSPFNYKGGASLTFGSGISWAKEDYETYLSFAYRYAHTSFQQKEYNQSTVTYNNSLNRLEIKFGFRF